MNPVLAVKKKWGFRKNMNIQQERHLMGWSAALFLFIEGIT
jgi:hypothetical protein